MTREMALRIRILRKENAWRNWHGSDPNCFKTAKLAEELKQLEKQLEDMEAKKK